MDAQSVGIGVTILLAWSGFLIAIIKWLLDKYAAVMEAKIAKLAEENAELLRVIAALRAELPIQYVRQDNCKSCREDWRCMMSAIDQKFSELSNRIAEKFDEFRRELYERNR